MICVDERYSKLYNTYCDEDTINKFLKDVIKESEYFSQVIETVFNKPLVMSETNHEDLIILLNAGFINNHMKKVK